MTFENVIFDLDGTLIDSAQLTGAIIDQMLAERGAQRTADRDLIRAMDAVGGEAMIAAVMGPHSQNATAEIADFRARHRRIAIPASLPFPGVSEALAELRARGTRLAICSNKPQDLCERIITELGFSSFFEAVVGSLPQRPRKPDPTSARLALDALGGGPGDTLYCGDSPVDVATARAAGLDVCLVSWGYGTREALARWPATLLVQTMAELVAHVHDPQRLRLGTPGNAA